MRFPGFLGLALALGLLASSPAAAQCALCRDAVAASSAETREAFNYAILGLAFAPYGIAGIAAFAVSPALRAFVRARFARLRLKGAGINS